MTIEREHYEAILKQLSDKRDRIKLELTELENAIPVIQKMMRAMPPITSNSSHSAHKKIEREASASKEEFNSQSSNRFAGLSMRWAALWVLAEATEPLPTAIIAAELDKNGIVSKSANFVSNISAVLSAMTRDRNEVNQIDGKWQITDHGREVWKRISDARQREDTRLEFSA